MYYLLIILLSVFICFTDSYATNLTDIVSTADTTTVVISTSTTNTVESPEKASIFYFNNYVTAGTAVSYTLPTAGIAKQRCYKNYTGKSGTITIQTSAAGQYIDVIGVATASGGYVISSGALGDGACVVGIDSTHWILYINQGTWAVH